MDENKTTSGIQINGDTVTIPAHILFFNTVAIINALTRINDTLLPLPVSYRVERLVKALQGEFKEIDKIRLELFKLHGKETEPGTFTLEGNPEAQEKFTKDFDDMMSDKKPSFRIINMSINDPTSYGEKATFAPKDLSILIDLGLLNIIE